MDQRPLDEGPRPTRGNVRCLLHDIVLEGNMNDLKQQMKFEGERVRVLEKPFWKVGTKGGGSGSRV